MKRTIFKGLFILFLLAALTVAGGAAFANGSKESSGGVTELSFWQPQPSDQNSVDQNKFLDIFEKAHPEIHLTVRNIPFANYDTSSNAAFNAKSGPDVLLVNSVDFGSFASRGFLKPIGSIVAGTPGIQESDFYEAEWQSAFWKGQQEGLPIDTGTRVLLWNKTLFQQAGVAPFGKEVSWADMLAAAKKITQPDKNIYGWRYVGGQNWLTLYSEIGPFVQEAGGTFLNDQLQPTLNTQPVLDAVKFYTSLAQYAPKSDIVANDTTPMDEAFGKNQAGMIVAGFWELGVVKKANPDVQFGEALPKNANVDSSTGGWILAVPSYVPDSKAAALRAFFQVVFDPKNLVAFTGLMPALKAAEPNATSLQTPEYDLYWDILRTHAEHPIPLNPYLPQQSIALMQNLQKVLEGDATPEQAMQDTQKAFIALQSSGT